jgi:iron complex transport system substrate-binding protein
LKPVGTTAKLLHAFPYRGMLEEVADVGSATSLEEISGLKPDLIVTSKPNHEPLSRLATTISIPWGREDCLEQLQRLGRALNRTSEAEAWIRQFQVKERRAADLVAGHVEPHATAAVFEFWPDRIWAVNIGYGRGLRNLYKSLALRPPEALAPFVLDEGVGLELSPGMLRHYAADHIFVTVWEEGGGAEYAKAIMSDPEWLELPAVRNGNVYVVQLDLFKHNDPIALEQQLDVQTEHLTKVHGKPHNRK